MTKHANAVLGEYERRCESGSSLADAISARAGKAGAKAEREWLLSAAGMVSSGMAGDLESARRCAAMCREMPSRLFAEVTRKRLSQLADMGRDRGLGPNFLTLDEIRGSVARNRWPIPADRRPWVVMELGLGYIDFMLSAATGTPPVQSWER